MGVHQWHVQVGHPQLWLSLLPALVDGGSHREGHCVKYAGGELGTERKGEAHPSLLLSHLHLSDQEAKNELCQCQSTEPHPASRTAICFVCWEPFDQLDAPCLPLCYSAWSWSPSWQYRHSSHMEDKQLTDPINPCSAHHHSYSNPLSF